MEPFCQCCFDDENLVALPCGNHYWCTDCIPRGFESVKTEQDWPVQCASENCNTSITLEHVKSYISSETYASLKDKLVEWDIPAASRTYCADERCGAFIPAPNSPDNDEEPIEKNVKCLECSKETCRPCKSLAHDGPCTEGGTFQETVAWSKTESEGGKFCASCAQLIVKNEGCQHMTCICGYQFCWLCERLWSECLASCPGSTEYANNNFEDDEDDDDDDDEDNRVSAAQRNHARASRFQLMATVVSHLDEWMRASEWALMRLMELKADYDLVSTHSALPPGHGHSLELYDQRMNELIRETENGSILATSEMDDEMIAHREEVMQTWILSDIPTMFREFQADREAQWMEENVFFDSLRDVNAAFNENEARQFENLQTLRRDIDDADILFATFLSEHSDDDDTDAEESDEDLDSDSESNEDDEDVLELGEEPSLKDIAEDRRYYLLQIIIDRPEYWMRAPHQLLFQYVEAINDLGFIMQNGHVRRGMEVDELFSRVNELEERDQFPAEIELSEQELQQRKTFLDRQVFGPFPAALRAKLLQDEKIIRNLRRRINADLFSRIWFPNDAYENRLNRIYQLRERHDARTELYATYLSTNYEVDENNDNIVESSSMYELTPYDLEMFEEDDDEDDGDEAAGLFILKSFRLALLESMIASADYWLRAPQTFLDQYIEAIAELNFIAENARTSSGEDEEECFDRIQILIDNAEAKTFPEQIELSAEELYQRQGVLNKVLHRQFSLRLRERRADILDIIAEYEDDVEELRAEDPTDPYIESRLHEIDLFREQYNDLAVEHPFYL